MSLDVYEDIERCMSGGWSDGLPVIPPHGSLVDEMLAATGWDYTEVVGRLSVCIAEHPETVWAPFHTQFGLPAPASAVTVVSSEGPQSVNNHHAETGEAILETIAGTLANEGTTNFYWYTGGYLIVIGPEHMDLVARRYNREEARQFLYTRAVRPTDELLRIGRLPKAPRRGSKVGQFARRDPAAEAGSGGLRRTDRTIRYPARPGDGVRDRRPAAADRRAAAPHPERD